jgi:glycosyltransferase involved in cell wall biosynthesis
LPPERVTTVYNPVVDSELAKKAQAPIDHAWFMPGAPPVIIYVGRLSEEKDFSTLLQAFAQVRAQRHARLLLLGEGRMRRELTALGHALGIAEDMSLHGFTSNPFAYMARAAVFVLSSAYEALPSVSSVRLKMGVLR